MVAFQTLNVHPQILERLISGQKELELLQVDYLSTIRADPRDITSQQIVSVTARMWAQDVNNALGMLEDKVPVVEFNGLEQKLEVMYVIYAGPVKGPVGIESMLDSGTPSDDSVAGKEGAN